MIDFSALRHVVPDGDIRIGSDGFVGMSEYMTALVESERATIREGIKEMLADVATWDAEMARRVANTDVVALADEVFERRFLPILQAHFEQGQEIFAGRSVDH